VVSSAPQENPLRAWHFGPPLDVERGLVLVLALEVLDPDEHHLHAAALTARRSPWVPSSSDPT
jgi:hypothetical protein